jgi:hypothetical protein
VATVQHIHAILFWLVSKFSIKDFCTPWGCLGHRLKRRLLREKHRLRVFENRVLGRIFGPKTDGVTSGWRKLLNEELHNLYSSSNIIKNIK